MLLVAVIGVPDKVRGEIVSVVRIACGHDGAPDLAPKFSSSCVIVLLPTSIRERWSSSTACP